MNEEVPTPPGVGVGGIGFRCQSTGCLGNLGYIAHAEQEKFHRSRARFRTIFAGVKGGKTEAGARELLKLALETPGLYWIVGPTYPMVRVAEEKFRELLEPIWDKIVDRYLVRDRVYVLKNGGRVECRSAEWPNSLRGPSVQGAWPDEVAYFKQEALAILRTRVTDTGGRIWLTTTPKGRNAAWQWFERGLSKEWPEYESFTWATVANTTVEGIEEDVEEARRSMNPDFFAQEYEAAVIDQASGVFRKVPEVPEVKREARTAIVGADLAKHKDWTALVVMNEAGDVIDFDRWKDDWPVTKARIKNAMKLWKAELVPDASNIGDRVVQEITDEMLDSGLGVHPFVMNSNQQKSLLIETLKVSVENGEVKVPVKYDQLLRELKWYEYEVLKSGLIRYSAPHGMTDDCVIALALANYGRIHYSIAARPVIVNTQEDGIRPADFRQNGLLSFTTSSRHRARRMEEMRQRRKRRSRVLR